MSSTTGLHSVHELLLGHSLSASGCGGSPYLARLLRQTFLLCVQDALYAEELSSDVQQRHCMVLLQECVQFGAVLSLSVLLQVPLSGSSAHLQ